MISGAYSSIFIASPVLTHWKEREAVYVRRRSRIREALGGPVPAYAVATQGGPVDVEPKQKQRADAAHHRARAARPGRRARRSSRRWCARLARAGDGDPGAGAPIPPPTPLPEDLVLKDAPKRDKPKRRQPRNKRHGRAR